MTDQYADKGFSVVLLDKFNYIRQKKKKQQKDNIVYKKMKYKKTIFSQFFDPSNKYFKQNRSKDYISYMESR